MKALNRGGNNNEILRVFTSGGFANLPVSRANVSQSKAAAGPPDERLVVEVYRSGKQKCPYKAKP
jgi:hypothetical protein